MKKVVISASSSLRDEINKWIKFFQDNGFDVLDYPKSIKGENFLKDFPPVHKEFYKTLNNADIHFIANENKNDTEGYIGVAVFAEIAFTIGLKLAHNKNIRIILYQKPLPESLFYEDLNLWMENGWLEIFDESKL